MMTMGRPKVANAKSKSVTIRITEEAHKKLSEYAAEHKTTMTDVILQSLEKLLSS